MSSFIHDIIKINYIQLGYLPNHPYHLISDAEMFDAFLSFDDNDNLSDKCYFAYMYARPEYLLNDATLSKSYSNLVALIKLHIDLCKEASKTLPEYSLPDWIYSYMLGVVISENSDVRDKHDLFVMLGSDNLDDEFNISIHNKCLGISRTWLSRLTLAKQHLGGSLFDAIKNNIVELDSDQYKMLDRLDPDNGSPAIFGEPHIIKHLRSIT